MAESKLGGSVGPRVARLVSDAMVNTRQKMHPEVVKVAVLAANTFIDQVGNEVKSNTADVFDEMAANEEFPPWARKTFNFLARGHGQWQAMLGNTVVGGGIGNSIIDVFNNALAPGVQKIIAAAPNGLLDPGTVAGLVARNRVSLNAGLAEAARNGISRERFHNMVDAAQVPPAVAQTLAMLNHGDITVPTAVSLLKDTGLRDELIGDILELRRADLTPEQAADMVQRGILSESAGEAVANRNGMIDADFQKLAQAAGQAPGIQDMLRLFRAGKITRPTLERAIRQSNIRNEWIDEILALRFLPAPTDAALNAATQNLLSKAEAKRIWSENGIDPGDFDWALESYGRPLSPEQAGELFNRGILTRDQVKQMFLESNVKNKYVDLVYRLAERLPPMELTVRMVREGAMTAAEGIRNLRQLGFAQRYAEALVELGTREKTSANRDLSVATLLELYEGHAITRSTILDALDAHGYEPQEAEWLLSIAEIRRDRRLQDSAISRVRARFITSKITETDALTALDALQVPSAQRDDLMDTWKIEREVSAPVLTVSQIQQAMRRGLIEPQAAFDRISGLGYDAEDATILVNLAVPTPRR